jgi:hypothetical protein
LISDHLLNQNWFSSISDIIVCGDLMNEWKKMQCPWALVLVWRKDEYGVIQLTPQTT